MWELIMWTDFSVVEAITGEIKIILSFIDGLSRILPKVSFHII